MFVAYKYVSDNARSVVPSDLYIRTQSSLFLNFLTTPVLDEELILERTKW